jgi:hypothetical protein
MRKARVTVGGEVVFMPVEDVLDRCSGRRSTSWAITPVIDTSSCGTSFSTRAVLIDEGGPAFGGLDTLKWGAKRRRECAYCGMPPEPGRRVCHYCGAKLEGE